MKRGKENSKSDIAKVITRLNVANVALTSLRLKMLWCSETRRRAANDDAGMNTCDLVFVAYFCSLLVVT